MKILTPKQKIVLQAMKEFFARNGKMPTTRELKEEIGKLGLKLKSLRSIFLYINALEEKGFIKRISGDRKIEFIERSKSSFVNVPILGTTSAGSPTFFAEENLEGYLNVSKKITRNQNVFAVKVSGDSMDLSKIEGKKINDGDYIIINADYKNFTSGDKVLVVIDGLATVKTYKKIDNQTIGLFPESTNEEHKPIYLTPEDNFIINGKIVDVLKSFSHGE